MTDKWSTEYNLGIQGYNARGVPNMTQRYKCPVEYILSSNEYNARLVLHKDTIFKQLWRPKLPHLMVVTNRRLRE